MIERLTARILLLLLSLCLALPLRSAESAVSPAGADQQPCRPLPLAHTNVFHPLSPGAIDGQIAAVTAYMLTNYHYLKKPFDDTVSSQFLDRYLETFDPQHIYFTQADLAEFEAYRTNLDDLTNTGRRPADTSAACAIFNRFMERLEQRTAYADDLLKNEKFTFDTDERITINRKDLPYPADLDEAKKLWRERLRFEYLQELLGKIGARKKNLAAATKLKPLSTDTNALVKSPAPLTEPKAGSATAPARAEARRGPAFESPKGGELASALPASAQERRIVPEATPEARPDASLSATNEPAVTPPKKTDDEEIVETLTHRYHRNLRFFTEWNNEDVLQTYLTALAHVYDPHSDYLGRAQLEQLLDQHEPQPVRHWGGTDFRGWLLQDPPAAAGRAGDQEQADQSQRSHRGRGAEQSAAGGHRGDEPQQGRATHSRPQGHGSAPDNDSRRRRMLPPAPS